MDGAVRFKVLRALVKLRRQQGPTLAPRRELRSAARSAELTLDHAEELLRWHSGRARSWNSNGRAAVQEVASKLDPCSLAAHHLLADLVRDKEQHATQRLFMLLDLLYQEDFEDIERGLRSKKPKTRASSLELVENIVTPPLRQRVLALVGDDKTEASRSRTRRRATQTVLRDMLARGGTIRCARSPSTAPSSSGSIRATITGRRTVAHAVDRLARQAPRRQGARFR